MSMSEEEKQMLLAHDKDIHNIARAVESIDTSVKKMAELQSAAMVRDEHFLGLMRGMQDSLAAEKELAEQRLNECRSNIILMINSAKEEAQEAKEDAKKVDEKADKVDRKLNEIMKWFFTVVIIGIFSFLAIKQYEDHELIKKATLNKVAILSKEATRYLEEYL